MTSHYAWILMIIKTKNSCKDASYSEISYCTLMSRFEIYFVYTYGMQEKSKTCNLMN